MACKDESGQRQGDSGGLRNLVLEAGLGDGRRCGKQDQDQEGSRKLGLQGFGARSLGPLPMTALASLRIGNN